ncbi:MAG: hypothetical protein R3284_11455, partial [Rubricoccaceae bacterium]|nr:hypothetical protein [Rubricoccaceae bacterium]
GVVHAVELGKLDEMTLDAALQRVQTLREKVARQFGREVFQSPESYFSSKAVGCSEHVELAERVAREAIRVEGQIPELTGETVLIHIDREDDGPFLEEIRRRLPTAPTMTLSPDTIPEASMAGILGFVQKSRNVVVTTVVKPAAWHNFGLSIEVKSFVQTICQMKPTVVASLGSAQALKGFEQAYAHIFAYSDVPVSQRALADVLLRKSS